MAGNSSSIAQQEIDMQDQQLHFRLQQFPVFRHSLLQESRPKANDSLARSDGKLQKGAVLFEAGDFVFLRPGVLDELQDAGAATADVADYASKGRFHKGGANSGLRPYGIAQLLSLGEAKEKKKAKVRLS